VAADPDAFLQLSEAEMAALGQLGVRRAVAAGEYLYREGDPGYDFYVVHTGAVEPAGWTALPADQSFSLRS
jgi:CRP-like cAMP-binding protein